MQLINLISSLAIPLMLFGIIAFGAYRRAGVYDCFVQGAADGLGTVIRIIPPIIGILCAVAMMRESGLLELIMTGVRPVTRLLGFPDELVPMAMLRPISGSGSLALLTDLINRHGPDSFIGQAASVMMGSTETTFYTLAVYFGAAQVYRTRHALPASLVADGVGLISAVMLCRIML